MNKRIDNYYISVSGQSFKCIGICLDGQKIIHEKFTEELTEGNVTKVAIGLIEDYNKRHGCKWGELESKKSKLMHI